MKKRILAAAALAAILGAGCTRRIYVPQRSVEVMRDTVYRSAWRVDSVARIDSVTERTVGDTLIRTVVRERWRTRILRDTLFRDRTDTLHIEKTVTASGTDRKRSDSLKERIKRWLGGMVLGAFISIWALHRRRER